MVMSPPTRRTSPKTATSARSVRAAATAADSSHASGWASALSRPRSTWMRPGTCRKAFVIDCAVASPNHASSRGASGVAKGRISTLRTFTGGAAAAAGTGAVCAHAGTATSKLRSRKAAVRMVALAQLTRVMSRSSLSRARRPEARGDPAEKSVTNPAQPDLRDEQHGARSEEPWPQVQGEARLPAILKEHVTRTNQGAAARELRDLPQERLVDTQVPELLRIRYQQACQL